MTLNELAAFIANHLNQPFNHELKERIKDEAKAKIAVQLRRSSERHGIDDYFLVSYTAELVKVPINNAPIEVSSKEYKVRTKYKVPTPIRLHNDSPFTFVGSDDGLISLPKRNAYEANIMHSYSSIGEYYSYTLNNGYIEINDIPENRFKGKYLRVQSAFESPEQVLGMYEDSDGQDIQLPFPIDIIGLIKEELLNQFGSIAQKDISVGQNKE